MLRDSLGSNSGRDDKTDEEPAQRFRNENHTGTLADKEYPRPLAQPSPSKPSCQRGWVKNSLSRLNYQRSTLDEYAWRRRPRGRFTSAECIWWKIRPMS